MLFFVELCYNFNLVNAELALFPLDLSPQNFGGYKCQLGLIGKRPFKVLWLMGHPIYQEIFHVSQRWHCHSKYIR